jgi:hypothetical protein
MELCHKFSSSSLSAYSARRTAAILTALADAHQHSASARDGYHFDTMIAILIQQYTYPLLLPCSLLSYRQLSRWQYDEQTLRTPDMYTMLEQLSSKTRALSGAHVVEAPGGQQEKKKDEKDDEDERCRSCIRQQVERLKQLNDTGRQYVACIAGEPFNFNALRASCSPPASLSPPYYTYFVVAEQHDLDDLPTEAALCEWLLLKYQRFGGKQGDSSETGDVFILALIEAVCQQLDCIAMFCGDEVSMTLFCSAKKLDTEESDKE